MEKYKSLAYDRKNKKRKNSSKKLEGTQHNQKDFLSSLHGLLGNYQVREIAEVVQRKQKNENQVKENSSDIIQRKINLVNQRLSASLQDNSFKTTLPVNIKSRFESISGFDLSDVKVHRNSPKPVDVNAHAYTQGSNIYIAPGQDKHLAHEAWHVVQQKQGRVKSTMQMKGANINDDSRLEKEADVMGKQLSRINNKYKYEINQDNVKSFSNNKNIIQRVIGDGGISLRGYRVKDKKGKIYSIVNDDIFLGKVQYTLEDEGGNQYIVAYDDERFDLIGPGLELDDLCMDEIDMENDFIEDDFAEDDFAEDEMEDDESTVLFGEAGMSFSLARVKKHPESAKSMVPTTYEPSDDPVVTNSDAKKRIKKLREKGVKKILHGIDAINSMKQQLEKAGVKKPKKVQFHYPRAGRKVHPTKLISDFAKQASTVLPKGGHLHISIPSSKTYKGNKGTRNKLYGAAPRKVIEKFGFRLYKKRKDIQERYGSYGYEHEITGLTKSRKGLHGHEYVFTWQGKKAKSEKIEDLSEYSDIPVDSGTDSEFEIGQELEYNILLGINNCLITAIYGGEPPLENLARIRDRLANAGFKPGVMLVAGPNTLRIIAEELGIQDSIRVDYVSGTPDIHEGTSGNTIYIKHNGFGHFERK